MATEDLVPGAVRREERTVGERTVLLVCAVRTVLVSVTGETSVNTESRVCTLDLPVSTVVVLALSLVPAVTAVLPAVTAPPLVNTGAVSTGEVAGRAGDLLVTPGLVTAVTTVWSAVTHLAGRHTQSLVNTLKLSGQTDQVVGPVARLDCLHTADLVSFVLTVGHPVAPHTEAHAGPVVTAELVPGAADRTVKLIIRAVSQSVTTLFEGEAGPVTAEELCAAAVSLAPGLVRAVRAVLAAVTAREVGDAGPVLLAAEVSPETGPDTAALSAVEDRDRLLSLALRHLLQAEVGVGHPVLPAHWAAAPLLSQTGGEGRTHLYSLVQAFLQSGLVVVVVVVVVVIVGLAVLGVVTMSVTQSTTDSVSKLSV